MLKKYILSGLFFILFQSGSSVFCQDIFDLKAIQADLEVNGDPSRSSLGRVLAAGDINADGIDDIFMLDSFGNSFGYIIYGNISLGGTMDLSTSPADIRIEGLGEINTQYSSSHACFGDVNGDGIGDLIVSGYYNTYVIYGSTSLPSVIDLTAYSEMTDILSTAGMSTPSVGSGDFNQDGYDDVMIARMIMQTVSTVEVFVQFGGSDLPDSIDFGSTPPDVYMKVSNPSSLTLPSACPTDINHDGFDDVVFSSNMYWYESRARCGAVFAIYGDSILPPRINLDSTSADLSIFGEVEYGFLGSGIGAGDVGGDGFEDLIFSAPRINSRQGRTYVLYGDSALPDTIDLLDTTVNAVIYGMDTAYLGGVIATGDFNRDGHADMLLGRSGSDLIPMHLPHIRSFLIFGTASIPSAIHLDSVFTGITLEGEKDSSVLGADVAFGDVNGDGFDDLILGAPGFGQPIPGKVYVIFGDSVIHRGDPNYDKIIDISDIVYLLNYLFKSGPVPYPKLAGDATCDGIVDVGDIIFLINYLFKGGPAPHCP